MEYQIPSYKELVKLAEDNVYTERYDGIYSSFQQIAKSRNFILMINSVGEGMYDGEWVRVNGEWERPDGSVPLYARAFSSGKLKR
jgi:hypothetical protein